MAPGVGGEVFAVAAGEEYRYGVAYLSCTRVEVADELMGRWECL